MISIFSSIIALILVLTYVLPVSQVYALENFDKNEQLGNVLNKAVEQLQPSDKNIQASVDKPSESESPSNDNPDNNHQNAIFSQASSDSKAPAKVKHLSAKATSNTAVKLKWTANKESDINHYNIYKGTKSSFKVNSQTPPSGTSSTNSYSSTGLNPSTKYYYRVAAVDNAGNVGSVSSSKSVKTKAVSTSQKDSSPESVTGLTVTVVSSSELKLKWSANKEGIW